MNFVKWVWHWLGEHDRQIRSIWYLILIVGAAGGGIAFAWRPVGSALESATPVLAAGLKLLSVAFAFVIAIGYAALLRTEFLDRRAPRHAANGVTFLLYAICIPAVILLFNGFAALYRHPSWYQDEYINGTVAYFLAAAVLGVGALSLYLVGLWLMRFYWDTKVRLTILEDIARRTTRLDPAEERRAYFAQPVWHESGRLTTPLVKWIAPGDLGEH
jgi:hypothetical protein